MSRCRSCKAPIVWARTTKGRSIPLDGDDMGGWISPDRFEDGNLRATGDRARSSDGQTVMVVEVVPPETEGRHYRSHFMSCPDAGDWRKPRGAS